MEFVILKESKFNGQYMHEKYTQLKGTRYKRAPVRWVGRRTSELGAGRHSVERQAGIQLRGREMFVEKLFNKFIAYIGKTSAVGRPGRDVQSTLTTK